MAFTIKQPGRTTPRNFNNASKAIAFYRSSPVGTWIRSNKTNARLHKAI